MKTLCSEIKHKLILLKKLKNLENAGLFSLIIRN